MRTRVRGGDDRGVEVRVLPFPSGPIAVCTLKLEFDDPPDEREPRYPRVVSVGVDNGVAIALPWGELCSVPLPLPPSFVVRGLT